MHKSIAGKCLSIQNATRYRLFLALCLSLATVLLYSCREKSEKTSYSEVQGFDTPVKTQEIKAPPLPKADPHAGVEMPEGKDPHAGMEMPEGKDPHAGIEMAGPEGKLTWNTPPGWTAYPGKGMFYAILKTGPGEDALEVAIVAMAGEAGGLDANVERWLGQVGLSLPGPRREEFISKRDPIRTQGGLDLALFDFNTLQNDGGAPSMMVGVVKPAQYSFFVKMKGRKSDLEKQKMNFVAFCKSFAWKA